MEAQHAFPRDPLAASTSLRRAVIGLAPVLAAATLEQAELRHLAASRYHLDAGGLLLTRDGLEQATRPDVAAHRARLLAGSGARRVLDLTAGLGFDAAACLAEGLHVTAVERDPVTAAYLAHNHPAFDIVAADITAPGVLPSLLQRLDPADVVFVDPARRDPAGSRDARSGRARPERDPSRWSPSWEFIAGIEHQRIAVKVAPGFTPPADWSAEWISVHRTIVECSVFSWGVFHGLRRAVILSAGHEVVIEAGEGTAERWADDVGAWLHEPDPALHRAGALGSLLHDLPGLGRVDADSTWLTGDDPPTASLTAVARSYRVITELTGSNTEQRRTLADAGVDRLTVKCRDVDVDPRVVLRRLGHREGPEHVLVMTRRAGRTRVFLTVAATAQSQ